VPVVCTVRLTDSSNAIWVTFHTHAVDRHFPLCLVEGLPLAHDCFEVISQKGADRPPFLGRHDPRLSEKVRKFERDGLHDETKLARWLCALAAARA
jgi:hypothetical protein